MKASPEAIRAALTGRPGPHHRFLLGLHLGQIDALAGAVAAIDAEVERDLGPFREAVGLLVTIPGVADLTAEVVLSEIGLDMGRFPTAGQLISWAGLCPRQDESDDKRRSTRPNKGPPWLKTALVHPAWAAVRKKHSYSRPSSNACAPTRAPGRPSAPSPPSSSPPHTTCSRTAPSTPTRDPTTSERANPDPGKSTRQADRAPRLTCSISPAEPASI